MDSSTWKMNINAPNLGKTKRQHLTMCQRRFPEVLITIPLAYCKCGAADQGRDFYREQKERARKSHQYKLVLPQRRGAGPVVRGQISLPLSPWFSFSTCLFFFPPFVTISSSCIKSYAFIKWHVLVMSPPFKLVALQLASTRIPEFKHADCLGPTPRVSDLSSLGVPGSNVLSVRLW